MPELIIYIVVMVGIVFVAGLLIRARLRAVAWARKGSPAATFIGWALLLLSAGMNPQPPPQEQVQEAKRQKKQKRGSESGDPDD